MTSYSGAEGEGDGTGGSGTDGIFGGDEEDLIERSEGAVGVTTFRSTVAPYDMLVRLGSGFPIAVIRSEDGVYEMEQTLSF